MRWTLIFLVLLSALVLCTGQDMDREGDSQGDSNGYDDRHGDDDHHDHDDGHRDGDDDGHRDDDDHHDDDDDGHRDDDDDDEHRDDDDDDDSRPGDGDRDDGEDDDDDDDRHGCSNVHITGRHGQDIGHITSPNFPNNYPTERFECDYHIENVAGGHVRLLFDDFILAEWDSITIAYGKERSGARDRVEFHGMRRPYSIVSKGHSIWIRFSSDQCRHTATGFKASFKFVESSTWDDQPVVRQSVRSHPSSRFYAINFLHFPRHIDKTWILTGFEGQRLLIGIQEMFVHDDGEDSLEIRDGPTSEGALLARLGSPVGVASAHHYSSRSDSVYVRLRSEMYHHDRLVATFVAATDPANSGICPDGYFHCKHGDCIVSNVVCDGLDHCGDHSDEANCHVTPTISYPQPNPDDPFDCTQCLNGATCVPELHLCSCPIGYYGAHCEHPTEPVECDKCQNGATCTLYDDGNMGCVCQPGYYGTYCEFFEDRKCEGCENGGKCTDPYDGECVCPEGYYGLRCEHEGEPDDCGGCHNDGKCRSDGYCVCPDPFYGPHCEYSENECGGGCLHGGQCVYGDCQCLYGYYGDRCQYTYDPTVPEEYTQVSGWFIGLMVLGCALVVILLITITCCVCRKNAPSKAKKVKPYSISADLKYTNSLPTPPPPSYDTCHDNPTYVTVTDGNYAADNISLPPAYDEVNHYSNNPYLVEGTEKVGQKMN